MLGSAEEAFCWQPWAIASVQASGPVSPLKLGWVVGLVALYFVAAKVGLLFAAISPSASAVWPPTGIAFAACLVLGLRVWPAIFVGAFLANATTAGSVVTSLGIAAGNTLEAVVGASLIIRLAHGVRVFESVRGIFAFVAVAALGSTTISATIGVASLLLGELLSGADAARIWLTWWASRCHRQPHRCAAAGPLGEEPLHRVESRPPARGRSGARLACPPRRRRIWALAPGRRLSPVLLVPPAAAVGRVPLRRESHRDGDGPHVSDGGLGPCQDDRLAQP